MQFIPYNNLPAKQREIIDIKLYDIYITYNDWISRAKDDCDVSLTPTTLSRFIVRTSLGHPWLETLSGGRLPFLKPTDLTELKEEMLELCIGDDMFVEVSKFLDVDIDLKVDRLINAFKFLVHIKCKKLASKIPLDDDIEPSRQWIADTA